MIVINTIGAMIENRETLYVHCGARDCWNSARVDIEALAQRLGSDHSCMATNLKRYFRCSKCGSKDVSFILAPFTNCEEVLARSVSIDRPLVHRAQQHFEPQ